MASGNALWPAFRVEALLSELRILSPWVVVSGGFAWHLLSPEHTEHRYGHDHKDMDLFVAPEQAGEFAGLLRARGYKRIWTRFDKLPSAEDFKRYERHIETPHGLVKAQIDLFVKDMPHRVIDGFKVIEPSVLLSLYKTIHGSKTAWAVRQAARLMARGTDPQGRIELTQDPGPPLPGEIDRIAGPAPR